MSRPRLVLKPTYGKLTVVSDLGGNHALVRCECGTTKWVLRTNLSAGRIKSCGQPGCRSYTTTYSRQTHVGPSWVPRDAIPGLVARAAEPGGIAALAHDLNVTAKTIYDLLREIRERGGVEAYLDYLTSIQQASDAEMAMAPRDDTPRLTPGEVHPPSTFYMPR
jgi:hypothetical protein